MAEITYRRPEVSDAKNIVDFYNRRRDQLSEF